ncbi:MAG: peptide chain release factor N(5)-glutamine methyltransferase [Candidatus Poribacteria bacterium]|nr:peptide chain release factor N(5)-glutamine methyltransferase [Candidatus Poribacteria bacterium]
MKTWRVLDLIQWTTDYFKRHGIPSPRLDAELLLSHVLGTSRLQLYLRFEMPVFPEHLSTFRELIKKRTANVPVSYLTSRKEFFSLEFYVDSRVLIPRPETEVLVENVLQVQEAPCQLIDIGTGSGAIAISLAANRPEWEILATDISAEALEVAQKNAVVHQCADRLTFQQGNLFEPLETLPESRFDWIVSNPPYVSTKEYPFLPHDVRDHEPETALLAGTDGLDVIVDILEGAPRFLKSGGRVGLEIGHNHCQDVLEIVQSNSAYSGCQVITDYSGIERVVIAAVG